MNFLSLHDLQEYRRRIPTTDLYFLNPVRHLRRHDERAAGLPRLKAIAPNVYAIGRTGIVSRYGSPRDVDRLRAIGARQIVYIADDDFEAGAADPGLPASYRAKLAAFARDAWPALHEAADVVIVPSPALAAIYGAKARMMHPAWPLSPASTDHFARPRRIEIVHIGTGSHRADLAPIAADLVELLNTHPHARLTVFAGADAHEQLRRHPQVRSRRPMPWWRYKHVLPWHRFHLALYPLQAGPFNEARSANKLFEQAITGAAALMSPVPALRDAAGPELADLFVNGGPRQWRARIESDLADVGAARERAERTRAHVISIDALGQAAAQWLDILGADT
jgi:hypothetical protein